MGTSYRARRRCSGPRFRSKAGRRARSRAACQVQLRLKGDGQLLKATQAPTAPPDYAIGRRAETQVRQASEQCAQRNLAFKARQGERRHSMWMPCPSQVRLAGRVKSSPSLTTAMTVSPVRISVGQSRAAILQATGHASGHPAATARQRRASDRDRCSGSPACEPVLAVACQAGPRLGAC